MELIAELTDRTFGLRPYNVSKWRVRRASRTVTISETGHVFLMHGQKYNYYKIPGGGVEGNETPEQAAERETLEETGHRVKLLKQLGAIIEYRSKMKLLQLSYCFLAVPIGKPDMPEYTKKEKAERFEPSLAKNIDHAIQLVTKGGNLPYAAKFMVRRETLFLQAAKVELASMAGRKKG